MGAKNGKTHLGGDGLHKDIQGKRANPYQFRPSRFKLQWKQCKRWQLWQESLKMSSCKVTTTQLTSGSNW